MSTDHILAAQMWTWADPMIKRDSHGRILIVNAAFLQLYGGTVESWTGNPIQGWPNPKSAGENTRFESRIPLPTGGETVYDWMECTLQDGTAMAMARDVSAYSQASNTPQQSARTKFAQPQEAEAAPQPAPEPMTPPAEPQQVQTQAAPAMPQAQPVMQEPVQSQEQAQPQSLEPAPVPVQNQPAAVQIAPQIDGTAGMAAPAAAIATGIAGTAMAVGATAMTAQAAPQVTPMAAPVQPQPAAIETPAPQTIPQPAAAPAQAAFQPPEGEKPPVVAPLPVAAPVADSNNQDNRDFERRALPIENGDAILGNNWRDAVIAKAVGVEENAVEPTETPEPSVTESGNQLRVLLAEDNAINALLTRTLLEADGCLCDVVEDGALAVEALKNNQYDLVFMDMRMPNMDGLEATRKIRSMGHNAKTLPIVALTANAFDDDRNACFDSGMNDFMTKPVSAEELSAMVKTHTSLAAEKLAS